MVEAIVVFTGWHPELAQAEFHAMCPKASIKITDSPRIIVVKGDVDIDAISIHSSAEGLLFDGGVFRFTSQRECVDRINSWIKTPSGSVAVRAWRHEGKIPDSSLSQLQIDVGAHLFASGCKVDLESPVNTLAIIIDGKSGLVAFGWLHGSCPDSKGWSSRAASKRPFFKPVSLEPRLARCAVNLACGARHGAFIDPMCGTGGLLIEAAVIGRDTVGLDIEGQMVDGSKRNLSHFGLKAEVVEGDATIHLFEKQIAGIAVDPPYGRNSQGSADNEVLMLAMLSNLRSQVKAGTGLVMILPVIEGVVEIPPLSLCDWKIETQFDIPVHASLARKLILARASPRD
jgi:tRNA (guanine10-N2)-dimethyltransferase